MVGSVGDKPTSQAAPRHSTKSDSTTSNPLKRGQSRELGTELFGACTPLNFSHAAGPLFHCAAPDCVALFAIQGTHRNSTHTHTHSLSHGSQGVP